MRTTRRDGIEWCVRLGAAVVLVALCVVRAAPPAGAEEDATAEQRAAEWRQALSTLMDAKHVDPELVARIDPQLPSFDPQQLEELTHTYEVNQLSDEKGRRVRHALRALAYWRQIGQDLDAGPAICLALGETTDLGWSRALLELCREPFGERLGRVASVLALDTRGPVRVIAGRLAGYLHAFCGGQGSEWGRAVRGDWDPTPLARSMASRLLADRNPAVAIAFVQHDAYSFEDVTIVDAIVERMSCDLQAPRVHSGLLRTTEMTVGEACRSTLDSQFIFYRQPSDLPPRWAPEPAERRVESLPDDSSADAIGIWWRHVRDAWSFAPDGDGWIVVLDETLTLPRSGATPIDSPLGVLALEVTEYKEVVSTDGPRMSLTIDVSRGDEWSFGGGARQQQIGYVSSSTFASGGFAARTSYKYAPATPAGIRMRLRLYAHP